LGLSNRESSGAISRQPTSILAIHKKAVLKPNSAAGRTWFDSSMNVEGKSSKKNLVPGR